MDLKESKYLKEPDYLEVLKHYANGENLNPEGKKQAEKYASYKVNTDWPQGLTEESKKKYSLINIIKHTKPKTDRDYQEILIDQDFPVPPMPEKSRKKQKNSYDWPAYFRAALISERMKNAVNKIRIENYAKEKAEIDQNTTLQFSSAYAKYLLEKL